MPTTIKSVRQVVSKSEITVIADTDSKQLIDIQFRGRPSLSGSQKKKYKKSGKEACHRLGVAIIKQEIRQEFIGTALDISTDNLKYVSLKYLNGTEQFSDKEKLQDVLDSLAKKIASQYLGKVRDDGNLFSGGGKQNNLSGKLVMLLDNYIKMGKERFVREAKLPIRIPKDCRLANDRDAYRLLREELGCDVLPIENWADLCEWYFAANFDESDSQDKIDETQRWLGGIFKPAEKDLARRKKAEIKRQNECRARAICRFKGAYGLMGLYAHPVAAPHDAAGPGEVRAGEPLAGAAAKKLKT